MLVITLKRNEGITVDGPARVIVSSVHGSKVRIGIEADRSVRILRDGVEAHGKADPDSDQEAGS